MIGVATQLMIWVSHFAPPVHAIPRMRERSRSREGVLPVPAAGGGSVCTGDRRGSTSHRGCESHESEGVNGTLQGRNNRAALIGTGRSCCNGGVNHPPRTR